MLALTKLNVELLTQYANREIGANYAASVLCINPKQLPYLLIKAGLVKSRVSPSLDEDDDELCYELYHGIDGLTQAQIAEKFEVSPPTVAKAIRRHENKCLRNGMTLGVAS